MTIYLLMCRQCSGTRPSCVVCHGFNIKFEFATEHGKGTVFEIQQLQKIYDYRLWKLFYAGKTFEEANKPDTIAKEIEPEDGE